MGQGWRGMSMGEALLPAGMRICSFLGYKEIRRGEQSQEHNAQITLPFTSALPPSLCSSKSLRQSLNVLKTNSRAPVMSNIYLFQENRTSNKQQQLPFCVSVGHQEARIIQLDNNSCPNSFYSQANPWRHTLRESRGETCQVNYLSGPYIELKVPKDKSYSLMVLLPLPSLK